MPDRLGDGVVPGTLVAVPFARRRLQGIVCALADSSQLPTVRDIEAVLDPRPVVTEAQLALARWISTYYAAPLSDVLGAMIPPGIARKTTYVLTAGADVPSARLTPLQRTVWERVMRAGHMPVDDLRGLAEPAKIDQAVASLVRRALLLKEPALSAPRVGARRADIALITAEGREALAGTSLVRAPKQRAVLEMLSTQPAVAVSDLRQRIPGVRASLTALARAGKVRIEERDALPSVPSRVAPTHRLSLSRAQQAAYGRVSRAVAERRHDVFLLHGVTGSGKTEVYLQAIADAVALGRQAIVMVPEISLTPQAVARVAGRFPGRTAVLHSQLSDRERVEEWDRVRSGQVDVVVGPRSALFAPLPDPGLVIVDEEHDPSYKQDASPRYNARDAATVLGRLVEAPVVLGSATPDVGTYHAAISGRIHLLELPDRPIWSEGSEGTSSRPMPPVEIVDMRQELKQGNRGMFSEALFRALGGTLAREEQALLFLNRRGASSTVLCRDCGYVARCPRCDIPFTYHLTGNRLMCHRCDRRAASPTRCPSCGGTRIRFLGVGTQRIEEEVRHAFPAARVLRWDRDVTGAKNAHERILQRFAHHDADILVGTQMIAKGLDFPLVTLVGVIAADTGLHMPDFRAPERSFQLLTQVAGRAGRAHLRSQVVVQTYTPEHYAIQAAGDHDYARFFHEEMSFRRSACYPPFARLARFVYATEDESACRRSAMNLRDIFERAVADEGLSNAEIIGPAPCFAARVNNRYYWQLIVRSRGRSRHELQRLLDYVPSGWSVDIDPVDLL